jgi:hypothetical protein
MEKVYLGTAQYDGGWYAYLTEVLSHKCIMETSTCSYELQALVLARRWARDNGRVIAYTI